MITVMTGCLPRVIHRGAGMRGESRSRVVKKGIPWIRARRDPVSS
jgi:hypothetical protein